MTYTLAFFNNKGGVGKTTLACNFAHFASSTLGLRTLVLDLDPQANATQLLLPELEWERLYEDASRSPTQTVLKVFEHILDGDSIVRTDANLITSDRFQVDVLAGHPSLSRAEDHLSRAWIDLRGQEVGGARRTNWLSTLRSALPHDLVVIDLGPSLGALNRSALVGCSHFMTPVAADLFSLYALENIGEWIKEWIKEYEDSMKRTREKNSTSKTLQSLPFDTDLRDGYIGYTVQQYVARKSGGNIRPTAAYDRYKSQIPDRAAQLKELSSPKASSFDLGVVPNMFSMVALAQNSHAPIATLDPSDGVRGAQGYQQARYARDLNKIFTNVAANMGFER
ncbi:ParA family protein [Mycolicibacterium neoaurum]|uniref:ParA family protein n=1 Tax=Mycolicibacterium neoaurum TaxID=1795 RepID=UPI00248C3DA9|nr:ParA family protein [Mycolicibacterium neoaurum]WBP95693.1 ParA family protein [Mycolicibacterium neoaurum]WBS09375.1 ParA family protein [Mycolicibacterium neoaurum]